MTAWRNEGIVDFLRDLIEVQKASFSDAAFEISKSFGTRNPCASKLTTAVLCAR